MLPNNEPSLGLNPPLSIQVLPEYKTCIIINAAGEEIGGIHDLQNAAEVCRRVNDPLMPHSLIKALRELDTNYSAIVN